MTVGPGITPGLLTLSSPAGKLPMVPSARGLCTLRAITAGGELHPALRTFARGFGPGGGFLTQSAQENIVPFGSCQIFPAQDQFFLKLLLDYSGVRRQ